MSKRRQTWVSQEEKSDSKLWESSSWASFGVQGFRGLGCFEILGLLNWSYGRCITMYDETAWMPPSSKANKLSIVHSSGSRGLLVQGHSYSSQHMSGHYSSKTQVQVQAETSMTRAKRLAFATTASSQHLPWNPPQQACQVRLKAQGPWPRSEMSLTARNPNLCCEVTNTVSCKPQTAKYKGLTEQDTAFDFELSI